MSQEGLGRLAEKLVVADITNMSFDDGFFDFVVSHGVLDSMPFQVDRRAMRETARCLKPGGLFYLDLISGDDSRHHSEFCGEEIVETAHEAGTVQSYFNKDKIRDLMGDQYDLEEGFLIRRSCLTSDYYHGRYHLVLKRLAG